MPINTDTLDMSQPLAGQDIETAAGDAPINPLLSRERLAQIGKRFREAGTDPGAASSAPSTASGAQPPAQSVAAGAPGAPTANDPASHSMIQTARRQGVDNGAPTEGPGGTSGTGQPAAEPNALDPATLISPRSREHFKALEAARDSFRTQFEAEKKAREELSARLQAIEAEAAKRGAQPPELEKLQAEAARAAKLAEEKAALEAKVEAIDFERSDKFQNWWKEEVDRNTKMAQRVVAPEHRKEIADLLMAPTGPERSAALIKILEGADEASKLIVAGALKDMEVAKLKREEALAQGSENLKKMREYERGQRLAEEKAREAKREQLTQAALTHAKQLEAFKPIEGDAEHNEAIATREAFVRAAVAGQLDEDLAVALPGMAFEAVHLREKVVPGLRAEIAKRDALIKQLQSAGPPVNGGSGPGAGHGNGESGAKPGASGRFLDRVRQVWNGQG